ncbi:MAG: twin-arginine translocase subunit TatB [Gammaproteobacteria bacterium]|nr:twin-arginine translocase subunit TatB [Gammaproteobacteria bacterium]
MDFGIGFWELCLTALVALIVLGPEKLPHAARMVGLWLGKGRRMMAAVRAEVDRELRIDELKQNIMKHNPAEALNELARDTREEVRAAQSAAEAEATPKPADAPASGNDKP